MPQPVKVGGGGAVSSGGATSLVIGSEIIELLCKKFPAAIAQELLISSQLHNKLLFKLPYFLSLSGHLKIKVKTVSAVKTAKKALKVVTTVLIKG